MRIVISASQNWLVKCLVSPLILIRAARSNLKCDYWKHPRILSAFTPWAHPVSVEGSAHSAWTRPPRSKSTPSFLLSRRRCHLRPNQPAAPARQPRRPVCELGSHHRHGHITTPCLGVHSYSRKMILFSWPCWTYCPGLDSPPSRVFLSWHSCSLLHPDPLPTTAQQSKPLTQFQTPSLPDFPAGSVAKTPSSQGRGPRVDPWLGNQIPRARNETRAQSNK